MKVIKETCEEMYVELEEADLPYSIPANGKTVYVRWKDEFKEKAREEEENGREP